MGATIINFEPDKCFECDGRGWTAVSWSIPDSYEATQNLVTTFTTPCRRCGGSGLE